MKRCFYEDVKQAAEKRFIGPQEEVYPATAPPPQEEEAYQGEFF